MPNYRVISNRFLTPETFVLRTERPEVDIRAGQCFSVGSSELAINREYSMYSAAHDPYVDFLVRKIDGGRVSTALSKLRTGDEIQISGPYGDFCLNEDAISRQKHIFIASGTGIAPFHSFVKTYPALEFELFHGVRHENETYDHTIYPKNSYKSYVSRPPTGKTGSYVTDGLKNRNISPNEVFYICGNRQMIIDTISILREKGIHGDAIFTETFF
jgi:ferredoxin--NADP+ reductase